MRLKKHYKKVCKFVFFVFYFCLVFCFVLVFIFLFFLLGRGFKKKLIYFFIKFNNLKHTTHKRDVKSF